MAQLLKGTNGSDLVGLFALTRLSTAASQAQSICIADLGTSFSAITNALCQTTRNALLASFAGSLGFGDDEALLMSGAAVMGYALALSIFGNGNAPKCAASGAALGAYAGYVARDACCGLDREAIMVSAVFGALAAIETSSASQQVADLQTAWNNIVALGLSS